MHVMNCHGTWGPSMNHLPASGDCPNQMIPKEKESNVFHKKQMRTYVHSTNLTPMYFFKQLEV